MRASNRLHPVAFSAQVLSSVAVAVCTLNPVILLLSLSAAFTTLFLRERPPRRAELLLPLLILLVFPPVNALLSHNGLTVLFVVNDTLITLEALLYGAVMGLSVAASLLWFLYFSAVMTSDKLLCLLGKLSPRAALVLSMSIRYVRLFSRQARRIEESQTALGLYREENLPDRVRGKLRVFSVLVTWALENGIITADSMTARGYGSGRRTAFSTFRFGKRDLCYLALSLLLAAGSLLSVLLSPSYSFYPTLSALPATPLAIAGYAAYALLVFLPLIIETEDALKWKFLQRRI